MKYTFRLTLQKLRKKDELIVKEPIETIETDNIVQLVLQFTMLIAKLEREIHEEELLDLRFTKLGEKDDIPF